MMLFCGLQPLRSEAWMRRPAHACMQISSAEVSGSAACGMFLYIVDGEFRTSDCISVGLRITARAMCTFGRQHNGDVLGKVGVTYMPEVNHRASTRSSNCWVLAVSLMDRTCVRRVGYRLEKHTHIPQSEQGYPSQFDTKVCSCMHWGLVGSCASCRRRYRYLIPRDKRV
jgi:hypothetical protein